MIMRNLLFYFFWGKLFSAVHQGFKKWRFWWPTTPFHFLGGVSGCFPASPFRPWSQGLSASSLFRCGVSLVSEIMNLSLRAALRSLLTRETHRKTIPTPQAQAPANYEQFPPPQW